MLGRYKLEVSGLQRNFGANNELRFGELDSNYNFFQGVNLAGTVSKGLIFFGTGEYMRITPASNLLVGGTTDSGERLQVNGNGTFGGRTIVGASYIADLGGVGNNCGILFGPGAVFSIDGAGSLTTKNLGSSANPWGSLWAGAATFSSDVTISGVFRETLTTNRQTASYTLSLTDNGKLVEMNVATANNLTVPLNSSIAFPIGTKIDLSQYGAGQTTIVATSGVTVRSAGGALKLAVQYSGGSLVKIGTDEWYLFGDITV